MNTRNNPSLTAAAQHLRKNMTEEERRLWLSFFKRLPVTVNRQKTIGRFIVDFYCASAKLVVEVDGAQHYTEQNAEKDRARDEYMRSLGLNVVRYSNQDVNGNFEGVCTDLLHRLDLTWADVKNNVTAAP